MLLVRETAEYSEEGVEEEEEEECPFPRQFEKGDVKHGAEVDSRCRRGGQVLTSQLAFVLPAAPKGFQR